MISVTDLSAHLAEPANANVNHVRRGKHLSTVFLLGIGDQQFYLTIVEGRVADVEHGPKPLRAVSFSIKAGLPAWREFWKPVPQAGYHDLFAIAKGKQASIEGNVQVLMANLRYIKDLLATPRGRMETFHG